MEFGVFDRYFYWKSLAFFNNLIFFLEKRLLGVVTPEQMILSPDIWLPLDIVIMKEFIFSYIGLVIVML